MSELSKFRNRLVQLIELYYFFKIMTQVTKVVAHVTDGFHGNIMVAPPFEIAVDGIYSVIRVEKTGEQP